MSSEKINLRKTRTFSESISITFDLVKNNLAILLKSFFALSFPFLIIAIFLLSSSIINTIQQDSGFSSSHTAFNILGYIFMSVGTFVYLLAINVIYKKYVLNDDPKQITVGEVWTEIVNHLGTFIGAGLLISILIFFGTLFLLIPGIYLAVSFSFIFFIITFENAGTKTAIDRCFAIIKNNWWSTFGFFLIIFIIQMALDYTLVLPITFINVWIFKPMLTANTANATNALSFIVILFYTLQIMFSTLLSSIIGAAIVVKYFSLVEEKEHIGIREEIATMDQDTTEEK